MTPAEWGRRAEVYAEEAKAAAASGAPDAEMLEARALAARLRSASGRNVPLILSGCDGFAAAARKMLHDARSL